MSAVHGGGDGLPDGPLAAGAPRPAVAPFPSAAQWRQLIFITLGALAVFVVMRVLPTGTNLNHMDFRVSGRNSIEFCDPTNPQFIPVVSVASPVSLALVSTTPAVAGTEVDVVFRLRTASGKPIAPEDLAVAHTKKLHLLIADPSLTDYQHVHPGPTKRAGEWEFRFVPRFGGTYRIFADFTPVATNRSLYASTDLAVAGGAPEPAGLAAAKELAWVAERAGYRFALVPATQPVHARQPEDLKFIVTRPDGSAVPMEPVMGAFAHLVAFDEARSGFAHLHPMETDLLKPPDAVHPTLNFKITIPRAGRYVIWAQVNLGGQEEFAPFWFEVAP
jgi:hypothetical protein